MNKNQYLSTTQFFKKNCTVQSSTAHTQAWLHGWATWASSQGLAWKDPTLSFMLCCSYLEILSNFQTRNPAFSFCTRSCKLCSQSYTYAHTHTDTHTLSIYVCVRTRRGPYPIHDLRAKLCLCTGVSQVIHQIIQWVVGGMGHNRTSLPVSNQPCIGANLFILHPGQHQQHTLQNILLVRGWQQKYAVVRSQNLALTTTEDRLVP